MDTETPKQAAAICYRLRKGQVEFLLVRTKSRQRRWIFPKGRIKKDEPIQVAALREAHEEAGKSGEISEQRLTTFRHNKSLVAAFLLRQESSHTVSDLSREPTWFSAKKAMGAVSENRKFKAAEELRRDLREARAAILHPAAATKEDRKGTR